MNSWWAKKQLILLKFALSEEESAFLFVTISIKKSAEIWRCEEMKERKKVKQVTILGRDPEDFDKKVNDILNRFDNVKIEREPSTAMMCYLTYYDYVEEPENLKDEYLMAGCSLRCGDCPLIRKSEDRRRKKHFCPVKQATVRLDMYCCNEFFERVERGEISIERQPELEIA